MLHCTYSFAHSLTPPQAHEKVYYLMSQNETVLNHSASLSIHFFSIHFSSADKDGKQSCVLPPSPRNSPQIPPRNRQNKSATSQTQRTASAAAVASAHAADAATPIEGGYVTMFTAGGPAYSATKTNASGTQTNADKRQPALIDSSHRTVKKPRGARSPRSHDGGAHDAATTTHAYDNHAYEATSTTVSGVAGKYVSADAGKSANSGGKSANSGTERSRRPRLSSERRPSIWEVFADTLPRIHIERY